MNIIGKFTNIVEPNLKNFEVFKFLKYGTYFIEIMTTSQVFGTIYDKLRFRIGEKTYCFAYGNVFRCDFGVQMSLVGLIMAIYSLTLNIFTEYLSINIPPIMKFDELYLCTFKIGLWLLTSVTLNKWFRTKFEKKYTRTINYEDRLNRIQRMDKMIGNDVRKVQKMLRYTMVELFISLILLINEKWQKRKLKKEANA
jgi:hypothetical protein